MAAAPPPGTPMCRLDGKIALIVGLGQAAPDGWGIGATIAVQLARQGAKIFGGNRSLATCAVTKQRVEAEGGVCDLVETEATDEKSVQALVDACVAKHGRIDILVTNVGRSEPGDPASMSAETWDAQVDINLKSVFLACHCVLPVMERQRGGGSIVCVSSIAGLRYIGKPQVGYSATKAAILQFVKVTAVMYARRGVRLNSVVPGLMLTPYTVQMAQRYAASDLDAFLAARNAQVPMGRMGDAWDVAHAVAFLASDEARYITGQKIVIDGGITSSTGPVPPPPLPPTSSS
ncbi:hypothetical protein VTK73DRAFT_5082 [Phialemonium thermophilum]|uniref:Uncharacterized protein n=1 Tax=Phialemonium thermophilum TaxID=223376 RepID=A0ABR3V3M1_9PEZI